MKIHTSRLTALQLDYIIALLEYPHLEWGKTIGLHWASNQIVIPELPEPKCYYSPSHNWEYVGKLISKESLNLIRQNINWVCEKYTDKGYKFSVGATPLIAVLRLYITLKLGSEIEIPSEFAGEIE